MERMLQCRTDRESACRNTMARLDSWYVMTDSATAQTGAAAIWIEHAAQGTWPPGPEEQEQ